MHEYGYPAVTPVSDYPAASQGLRSVFALDTGTVLRAKTRLVGASRLVFAPEEVCMHSLRSGGYMAMNIFRLPDCMLMAIGRWRLLGFMVYIQQDISSFSAGISVRTSQ